MREPRPQGLLGRAVGLRDRRHVGLGLDDQIAGPEARERDLVRNVGELERDREVVGHGAPSYGSTDGDDLRGRRVIHFAAAGRLASGERPMSLQDETTEVLSRLVQFNTVNPPGNERPAIEYLDGYLKDAGFETEQLAADENRPNLVATLNGSELSDGPTLLYLGHVDTVLADPSDWQHDPWSGDVEDGYLWGRGALDMKSQVAAEAVAGAALARDGWRPARGALRLVFVSDEETGGDVGARWLTEQHPDKVRCDLLLNEGAGSAFEYGGERRYGVCCGEKGIFRFKLTAHGAAGHASLPRMGDNALLKLAPALAKLAARQPSPDVTEAPAALLERLGGDPADPGPTLEKIREELPGLLVLLEPMLGVTLTPTMAHASDKINVIPSRAYLKVDCRVPPGLGKDTALERLHEVLGDTADSLRDRVHREDDRQRVADRVRADGRDRPLDRRPRRRARSPRPCCCPGSLTRAGSGRRSPTASPTASSRMCTWACSTRRRWSTTRTSGSTCATSATRPASTPTSRASCSAEPSSGHLVGAERAFRARWSSAAEARPRPPAARP